MSIFPVAQVLEFFSFLWIKDLLPFRFHAVTIQFHVEVLLLPELFDLFHPVYQHGKRRGLNPSYCKFFIILGCKSPGCVHSYQPVRFCTADSRLRQIPVFFCVFQLFHARPDCTVFHGTDPETFHRLSASGKLVHPPEDQFPFSSCITGIYHILYIRTVQQPFQCIKLFFFLLGNCQFPLIRDDRKIFILPAFISFIIAIRRQIFRQMPQAPAHDTVLSGKKSFLPVLRPDHTGDRS